jgi:formylglycine-generating enzyme required for sulfatase activity
MAGPAQPAPEPRTPNPEPAVKPQRSRSLTGFYVAICVLLVLGLLGAWLWVAWNKWWFDAGEAQRRQAEAARQLGLPVEKVVDLGGGVKLDLVLIPAGRFRMGDQAGQDEGGGHQWVLITKPFYIGKYEVTQEVWEKVMVSNLSEFKGAKNPVENVSWDDCQEFLKKLNALPHPSPLPPGEGARVRDLFRRPTAAEWEWACRAGTRTWFCFGDEESSLADYGWYDGNSGNRTHPVGTKKPNAWGLYDCHGNVWEWCGDWHDEYSHGWWPKADPTGPVTGAFRVLRGGSWRSYAGYCRSTDRQGIGPAGYRSCDGGFRLVVSSPRTP